MQEIDAEIAKLQRARTAIAMISAGSEPAKRRGRPPKTYSFEPATPKKRRTLSSAARAKIAAAQRKRWAAQKKSASA